MSTIYEINMSNAQADVNTGRVKQNSKIVEVFSALSAGKRPEVDDKTLDKSVATIKSCPARLSTAITPPVAKSTPSSGSLLSRSCWRLFACSTSWAHIAGSVTTRLP